MSVQEHTSRELSEELCRLLEGRLAVEQQQRAASVEAGEDPDDDESEHWVPSPTLGELVEEWDALPPFERAGRCGRSGPLDPKERKRVLAEADAQLHALLSELGPDCPLAEIR